MSVKNTTFGRHFAHEFVKHASALTNEMVPFEIDAPHNGYIIKGTVKSFYKDALTYVYIQQLNNCDACIVTTSCVHSKGHFNSVMRLISYDTVVCEVKFLSQNMHDDSKPYMQIVIGEHWNYSRTTVQHVYKFLRKFGIDNLCIGDLAKVDRLNGNGSYTYELTYHRNNRNKLFALCFTDDCVYDFALNNAQHVIYRYERV